MNLQNLTFVPLAAPPTTAELAPCEPLAPVVVTMTTFCRTHDGAPQFIKEEFIDPDTGTRTVVWSRITDALAYVRG